MATVPVHPGDRERVGEALSRLAARQWPGVRLLDLTPLAGDASSRRYLRCRIECLADAGVPDTLIAMAMDDAAVALSSEELGVFGDTGPSEIPFVNVWRFLSKRCDALPAIYDVAPERTCILLEDVGDVSLWAAACAAGDEAEHYFANALALLASIQRHAQDDGSGCYAFRQTFDEHLLRWELEHFLEYGIGRTPSAELAACRSEFDRLSRRLASLPRVFCHRDYHAWNIHVQGNRLRVLDFQDALLGPALYDVASLLTDRSTPRIVHPAAEKRLVNRFVDMVGTERAAGSADPQIVYHECALQRALKVIGRFHYLAERKGKPAYLDFLPDVIATARRLTDGLHDVSATRALLESRVKGGRRDRETPR